MTHVATCHVHPNQCPDTQIWIAAGYVYASGHSCRCDANRDSGLTQYGACWDASTPAERPRPPRAASSWTPAPPRRPPRVVHETMAARLPGMGFSDRVITGCGQNVMAKIFPHECNLKFFSSRNKVYGPEPVTPDPVETSHSVPIRIH